MQYNNELLKLPQINEIFERFKKQDPDPKIELDYCNNYTLLVAVVLSAQSTDKMVNRITPALFEAANTPEQMVALGEIGLKEYIKRIGLFNNKARNIIAMSRMLIDEFNSEVPGDFDSLVKLPGVGVKSANVVLNTAFDQSRIAVDTHVFRISNRIGFCKTKTPEETTKVLSALIPKHWQQKANHWLVLHGRYVCVARKPKCKECIINDICISRSKFEDV